MGKSYGVILKSINHLFLSAPSQVAKHLRVGKDAWLKMHLQNSFTKMPIFTHRAQ
jgi:hypothetical protein